MLNEVHSENDSENDRLYEAVPDSTFSWSELAFAPVEYQFGPAAVKPALMVVKHSKQKQKQPNTTRYFSIYSHGFLY